MPAPVKLRFPAFEFTLMALESSPAGVPPTLKLPPKENFSVGFLLILIDRLNKDGDSGRLQSSVCNGSESLDVRTLLVPAGLPILFSWCLYFG